MADIKDVIQTESQTFLQKYKTPLLVGGGVLGILAGAFLWNHFHQPQPEQPPAPVYETYEQSHSDDGVQKAADDSGVPLSLPQQREILQAIQDSDTQSPDYVVNTTGAGLAAAVKTEQVKSGADFTIVSPADKTMDKIISENTLTSGNSKALLDKSTDRLPTIPANTPVTLNQYNIKAYPNHLFDASVYGDGSGDVAYESKVKILGMQGYVGPVIKYDPNKASKVTVGARITVPL